MEEKEGIIVAQTAGFCWGVKRAMDITLQTAKDVHGAVYTHGPLIHNPQVIEMLKGKEVYAVTDADDLNPGSSIIVRTHGVTPHVRRGLKEHGLSVKDATCPLVARVQGIIKKYATKGYATVIIGDNGHAEVIGLMGYASERCHVIGSVNEVDALPPLDKVCVVAQTTCDTTKYDRIVAALKQKYPEAVVTNTICDATEERQGEVLEMARKVDAMVVVGGRTSANTTRLAKIAEEAGAVTFLIETEDEIDPDEIAKYERIGLTAGASTPQWMIQRVHDRLLSMRRNRASTIVAKARHFVKMVIVSNISLSIGAGFMCFTNAVLMGVDFSWLAAALAALFIFSMSVVNQLNDLQTVKHNEPEKMRFYLKNRSLMSGLAVAAVVMTAALSMALGPWTMALLAGAYIVGLAYTVTWFPKLDVMRIHRLKDIPASKDIFVAIAWAMFTALIPVIAVESDVFTVGVVVACMFTFGLAYIRSVLCDIRDIEGDRLVGRETIPILIGKAATKIFLGALTAGLFVMLLVATHYVYAGAFGYWLLGAVVYTGGYLVLYHRRAIRKGLTFDLVVDGVFHFSGLLAIIYTLVI